MKRTNIYLEEHQTMILDKLAAEQGVSRAQLVRVLIDKALNGQDASLAVDLAAIRESFGVLKHADFDSPERVEDERERHLARMWNTPS